MWVRCSSVSHVRQLPRCDERQPRCRQLQLRGVQALDAQAVAKTLQRMARGNLRLTTLVDVLPGAGARLAAGLGADGFQPLEPRNVDRLKRETVLKARLVE